MARLSDTEFIQSYMKGAVEFSGPHGKCWHLDRDSNILVVCSIKPIRRAAEAKVVSDERLLLCPNLNRRIAKHMAFNVFKEFDVPVDILLATRTDRNENTGAEYFQPKKQYQLIVGFRVACATSHTEGERDMGVRMFPKEHKGLTRLLNSATFHVSPYIASREIQALKHLNCAGVQFPIDAKQTQKKGEIQWQLTGAAFASRAALIIGFIKQVADSGVVVPQESEVKKTQSVRASVSREASDRVNKPLLTLDAYQDLLQSTKRK